MSSTLGRAYSVWEPGALAVIAQVNRTTTASDPITAGGRYAAWKMQALLMALDILDAVKQWDSGVQNDDVAAIEAGTAAMQRAMDYLPAFNAAAALWESECP